MKLKKERNASAPIAIAIYQHITDKGSAVITSIRTCCFTRTVDSIIKKDKTIKMILNTKDSPSAVATANINSIDREQCSEGIQLKIFLSLA